MGCPGGRWFETAAEEPGDPCPGETPAQRQRINK